MIIKHNDAHPDVIRALEHKAATTSDKVKRNACKGAVARMLAQQNSSLATDLIDVQFAQCDDWAVLHDLRLQVNGHAVHICHLLINTSLHFFCLDTRYIDYGMDLAADGQCHVFDRTRRQRIASPLSKAARDVRKLGELIQDSACVPRFLGLDRRVTIKGLVITNPALRLGLLGQIDNPRLGIHTSAALFPLLWKTRSTGRCLPRSQISPEALNDLAVTLAEQHRPTFSDALLKHDSMVTGHTSELIRQAA